MCGIVAAFGKCTGLPAEAMVGSLRHRGPDHQNLVEFDGATLGHTRLRILDLTTASDQPFQSRDGRFHLIFNGEIYNYVELRQELPGIDIRTTGDAEVLLEAFLKWGPQCLDRLVGMFSFVIWDDNEKRAFIARDRFGVKPLYFSVSPGGVVLASELAPFHRAGIGLEADPIAWSTYLATGRADFTDRTFWTGIRPLPAGHMAEWAEGGLVVSQWYCPTNAMLNDENILTDDAAEDRLLELLMDAVRLRFRSDVPVGVCLSGGLDSSTLLALIHKNRGTDDDVAAFTFSTGDPRYDETPWVRDMLDKTNHPLIDARLCVEDVKNLAVDVHHHVREPFGGIPTLAYALLFETAKRHGVTVLLDGQGLDEAFCGYDYFRPEAQPSRIVQGSVSDPLRPKCLTDDALRLAENSYAGYRTPNPRVDMQLRDLFETKLPRALRYNDRISMRSSRELREPFLDHRIVEFGLTRPDHQLFDKHGGKRIVRRIAGGMVPDGVIKAPKRPVQTPQREWLRGPLRGWTRELVEQGIRGPLQGLVDPVRVRRELDVFLNGDADNSFFVWQWISAGLVANQVVPS